MPSEKRLRQRANRQSKQQVEQKRGSRRNLWKGLRRGLYFAGAVLVFYLLAVFLGSRPEQLPSAYRQYRQQPTACGATAPPEWVARTYSAAGDAGLDGTTKVTATLVTSCGEATLELDRTAAPQTVDSFVFLAKEGFFDGTVFHRVVEDFVVQGGDPSADGSGGPGYRLPDELPPEGFAYERGVVAMANSGKNSGGSQFFVVIGEDVGLQNLFTVFGRVTSGLETFDAMLATDRVVGGDGFRSKPLESIYLERVLITES